MINRLIRWGLRIFAFGHMIEFFLALHETAYITATVAIIFGVLGSLDLNCYFFISVVEINT